MNIDETENTKWNIMGKMLDISCLLFTHDAQCAITHELYQRRNILQAHEEIIFFLYLDDKQYFKILSSGQCNTDHFYRNLIEIERALKIAQCFNDTNSHYKFWDLLYEKWSNFFFQIDEMGLKPRQFHSLLSRRINDKTTG